MKDQAVEEFEAHERTGRPLGDEAFIERASEKLGWDFKRKKPGPKGSSN